MTTENNTPGTLEDYSAAAALDFTKVYFVGAGSIALLGYLYSSGKVAGPIWFLAF